MRLKIAFCVNKLSHTNFAMFCWIFTLELLLPKAFIICTHTFQCPITALGGIFIMKIFFSLSLVKNILIGHFFIAERGKIWMTKCHFHSGYELYDIEWEYYQWYNGHSSAIYIMLAWLCDYLCVQFNSSTIDGENSRTSSQFFFFFFFGTEKNCDHNSIIDAYDFFIQRWIMGREKFEINWRKIVIMPHHTEKSKSILDAPPFHCRSSISILSFIKWVVEWGKNKDFIF